MPAFFVYIHHALNTYMDMRTLLDRLSELNPEPEQDFSAFETFDTNFSEKKTGSQPLMESETSFSRIDDLDAYLSSFGEPLKGEMTRMWTEEGAGWLPYESSPSLAIGHVYVIVSWAITHNLIDSDEAPKLRNALMQWFHERLGIDMGYAKKYLAKPTVKRKTQQEYYKKASKQPSDSSNALA